MTMEEKRDKNINLVGVSALKLFLEKGLDNVTIKDIAKESGLTERSIYRYFPTRIDLMLHADYLLWAQMKKEVEYIVSDSFYQGQTGLEQIRILLNYYSTLFAKQPKVVRLILESEMAFAKNGVVISRKDIPPGSFQSDTPLANAIRTGLKDGSVSKDIDAEQVYYLTYDSILGVMQRCFLGDVYKKDAHNAQKRIEHLSEMLIAAFQGKV